MSNERRLTDLEVLTSEIIAEQQTQAKQFAQVRTQLEQVLTSLSGVEVSNQRLNSLFLDLLEVLRRQDDAQDEVRYTLANHEQRLHKLEEPGTDDYPKPQ